MIKMYTESTNQRNRIKSETAEFNERKKKLN